VQKKKRERETAQANLYPRLHFRWKGWCVDLHIVYITSFSPRSGFSWRRRFARLCGLYSPPTLFPLTNNFPCDEGQSFSGPRGYIMYNIYIYIYMYIKYILLYILCMSSLTNLYHSVVVSLSVPQSLNSIIVYTHTFIYCIEFWIFAFGDSVR